MADADESVYSRSRRWMDRQAQANGAQRGLDGFGLRHPVANALAVVVVAAFFVIVFLAAFASWAAAVVLGIVFTGLVWSTARMNLRRRRRNGTLPE